MSVELPLDMEPPRGVRARWTAWRNRVLGSPGFRRWAAAFPLTRRVARRRAARSFDLLAGFVYTQVLLAIVESGVLARLEAGPARADDLAGTAGLSGEGMDRLLRAAAALKLVEPLGAGWWTLGSEGAALAGNDGAIAMVRHHRLFYADLADPLALLGGGAGETSLQRFWHYDGGAEEGRSAPYSELMAASQAMVSEQAVAAYDFARHRRLLDIGGGHGVFLSALAAAAPRVALGLFDLPPVTERAGKRFAAQGLAVALHPGDFTRDPIPPGHDAITLVRICHDHDDAVVARLLANARAALAPGGRLIIIEPMAGTPGAEAMGDAYFGFYLLAMGQGRPRTAETLGQMLEDAGFSRWRERSTHLPVIARMIVASA